MEFFKSLFKDFTPACWSVFIVGCVLALLLFGKLSLLIWSGAFLSSRYTDELNTWTRAKIASFKTR